MQKRVRAWATVGVMAAGVLAGGAGLGAMGLVGEQPAKADTKAPANGAWKVDSVHSNVVYRITHLGASSHYGLFFNPTGTLELDPVNAAGASMEITVPLSGLSTGDAKRDQHLKSPDFFSAEEFPTISFKSTGFKSAGEGAFDVTGDLTMLGKTKPVTAHLTVVGKGKGMGGGEVMGVEATFTVKRSDWGMTKYVKEGALGDEVKLIAALETHRK
ncbi:MAG: YceI family protein [Phycisphaerales bacterium]